MIGRAIRGLGQVLYRHPEVVEDRVGPGHFGRLKIALLSDQFTSECLAAECRIRNLTPTNYREVITSWQPDLVFVESAFHGYKGSWRYELAKQPGWLRLSKAKTIHRLIEFARTREIPTVFWNKDDGVFFEHFIDVATAFDFVFTTDADCLPRYRDRLAARTPVNTLSIPYQPAFHYFSGFSRMQNAACFTGSYYRRILKERRSFLNMIFAACGEADFPLNIYDRNRHRFSRVLEFRYPRLPALHIHPGVTNEKTSEIYKSHRVSFNVNSVTASASMYSRRLLEILACGGIAVTNHSRAVDLHFRDYCHVVETRDETLELLKRIRLGLSDDDLQRAAAGAAYVRENHTWSHRLEEICAIVGV